MLSLSQLLVLVAGGRPAGCETEEEDLRHHKCAGGHRPHRKEIQKQHTVEVSVILFYSLKSV